MTMDDAMALLQGLTAQQMRTLVLTRLTHEEAAQYDAMTRAVSYEVLRLVSARAILRQGRYPRVGTPDRPSDVTASAGSSVRNAPERSA